MKYLVMETHSAYAVVLDEEGRIIKAANMHYQVGDSVERIVALRQPQEKQHTLAKSLVSMVAMAACLCLIFFGYYRPNYAAYGTLRIQINPDVEMTISQTQRVLNIEGLNEDGQVLVEGFGYHGKSPDTVTEELMERAIQMGYLSDGDTISVTVKSTDGIWQANEEEQIHRHLEDRYGERIVIALTSQPQHDDMEVVMPVQPQAPSSETPSQSATPSTPPPSSKKPEQSGNPLTPDITDHEDTDYEPSKDGTTDYNDTDYSANNDGVTDYDDDASNDNDDDDHDDDHKDNDDNSDDEDSDDNKEEDGDHEDD